ncbi:hypothetical protein [Celeribacter arenosi]|uniref:Uncharacterized protein n=1 Tax=Celeribacter arenosi TaxID=792649 RepID=A0ABP7JTB3_9RHOB
MSGTVGPDQTLAGVWDVRGGQWCRTLSAPPAFVGTACQNATLNGDGTMTIEGGGGVVWAIE